MKVFLSHSFKEGDKKVVNWFTQLITDSIKGSEVITAQKPAAKPVWSKISGKINECQAIVALLTRDAQIKNKSEWRTKGWILSEFAYGFAKGLPAFAFVEENVTDIGICTVKEFVSFVRGKLDVKKQECIDYLESGISPFKDSSYSFESYDKRACILKNGHGICESIITVKATSDKFSQLKHSVSLGDSARKNLQLSSFAQIKKTSFEKRFAGQTLFADILDDFNQKRKLEITKLPESNGEKISFNIRFSPNLKLGEKVKYGWGWSSPQLFANKFSQLKNKCKKKNLAFIESCLVTRHPIEELRFRVSFEKGYPMRGKPWVEICDHNGNILETIKRVAEFGKMYYTVFHYNFSPVQRNAWYKFRWKPG